MSLLRCWKFVTSGFRCSRPLNNTEKATSSLNLVNKVEIPCALDLVFASHDRGSPKVPSKVESVNPVIYLKMQLKGSL